MFDAPSLAHEFGTPLYVLDLDSASRAVKEFIHAWGARFPSFRLAYSYKTNPLPVVAREFRRLGAGAEVVSGAEISWALEDGHAGRDIVFNGPVKTAEEIASAVSVGALVNLDSPAEVARLARAQTGGPPPRAGLRIRAEVAGAPKMHFGMSLPEAKATAEALTRDRIHLAGLHQHIGTNVHEPESYAAAWHRVLPLAEQLMESSSDGFVIDVGGGFAAAPAFGTGWGPTAPSPVAYADALARVLRPLVERGAQVVAEPGRCLVEPHGYLLTAVQSTKLVDERAVAILDGGVNLVPTTRQTPHPIRFENAVAPNTRAWDLHGPLCMAGDVVASAVLGSAALAPGDIVTIGNAGGYDLSGGFAWIRPHAPVVVLRGGKATLAHGSVGASLWRR